MGNRDLEQSGWSIIGSLLLLTGINAALAYSYVFVVKTEYRVACLETAALGRPMPSACRSYLDEAKSREWSDGE